MKKAAAKESGFVPWIWGWVKSIALALVVWFFLRTFLVEAFRIPSGSMENTLMIGDFLFVNKALYGAEVPLINKRLPAVRERLRMHRWNREPPDPPGPSRPPVPKLSSSPLREAVAR